jgi:hypothetical protein
MKHVHLCRYANASYLCSSRVSLSRYVDGVLARDGMARAGIDVRGSSNSASLPGDTAILLGHGGGAAGPFIGAMDELGFFREALGADHVALLAKGVRPASVDPPLVATPPDQFPEGKRCDAQACRT